MNHAQGIIAGVKLFSRTRKQMNLNDYIDAIASLKALPRYKPVTDDVLDSLGIDSHGAVKNDKGHYNADDVIAGLQAAYHAEYYRRQNTKAKRPNMEVKVKHD